MRLKIVFLVSLTMIGCDLVERDESNNEDKKVQTIEQPRGIDSLTKKPIASSNPNEMQNVEGDTVHINVTELDDEFDYVYSRTLSSGIKINWIKRNTGAKIRSGEMLMLEYRLSLPDGRIIDGNNKMKMPYLPFVVGYNMQQLGWDLALQEMCIGDAAKIEIPSKLAYGSKGLNSIIPPDTDNWLYVKIHGRVEADYNTGGIKYWELRPGNEVKEKSKVHFHMIASTKNKPNIFNTYQSKFPRTYALGQKNYPLGLEQILKKAKKGQYLFLILSPEMAYGEKGYLDLVLPNESVFYNLKIIDLD